MGYVIRRCRDAHYFTGEGIVNGKESFATWSPFPKFAKIYTKRGWAEKAALRWSATVEPLGEHTQLPSQKRQQQQKPLAG
jgi:hypothetical protein